MGSKKKMNKRVVKTEEPKKSRPVKSQGVSWSYTEFEKWLKNKKRSPKKDST